MTKPSRSRVKRVRRKKPESVKVWVARGRSGAIYNGTVANEKRWSEWLAEERQIAEPVKIHRATLTLGPSR